MGADTRDQRLAGSDDDVPAARIIDVVGGTYLERVTMPASQELRGSGLRAALALTGSVRLHTAIDDELADELQLVANAGGVDVEPVHRSEPVAFSYFAPLDVPHISGRTGTADRVTVTADIALVFGMVELLQRHVRATTLVFDPQAPAHLGPLDMSGLEYEHLHVLLNAREAGGVTGITEPGAAARQLLASTGADAVVVKLGAHGAVVATPGNVLVRVPAVPTQTVSPLGTGDVFAAGYVHALRDGADPVEATCAGSVAASHSACTHSLHLPAPDALTRDSAALVSGLWEPPTLAPQVYLAAPFFTISELWLVTLVRDVLLAQGLRVFSPIHDVGIGEDVAQADLEGLEQSSAVIALTDHSDAGTMFEIGWARKMGVPVVAYASWPDKEGLKMIAGSGCESHTDLSTAVYRAAWAALGMTQPPGVLS